MVSHCSRAKEPLRNITKPPTVPSPENPPAPWTLYVLRCSDQSLYCGITNNLPNRLRLHDAGKASRYTRSRRPLSLVRSWPMPDRSSALKAEAAFKRLPRKTKISRLTTP